MLHAAILTALSFADRTLKIIICATGQNALRMPDPLMPWSERLRLSLYRTGTEFEAVASQVEL